MKNWKLRLKLALGATPIVLAGIGTGLVAMSILFALFGATLQEVKALVFTGGALAAAGVALEEVVK